MKALTFTIAALAAGSGTVAAADVAVRCGTETLGVFLVDHAAAAAAVPEAFRASIATVAGDKAEVEVFTATDCNVEVGGEVVETGISRAKAFVRHIHDAKTPDDGLAQKVLPALELTDSQVLPDAMPGLFVPADEARSTLEDATKSIGLTGFQNALATVARHPAYLAEPFQPARADWLLYSGEDLVWMKCTENVKFHVPPSPETQVEISASGKFGFLDGATSVVGGVFQTECEYRSVSP